MVNGMTCGHYVTALTEEPKVIDGVQDVRIDLHVGQWRLIRADR